jgi:hypothetical protein
MTKEQGRVKSFTNFPYLQCNVSCLLWYYGFSFWLSSPLMCMWYTLAMIVIYILCRQTVIALGSYLPTTGICICRSWFT